MLAAFSSCTTPSAPVTQGTDIAIWTQVDNSGAHSAHGAIQPVAVQTVDSIYVTSASFAAGNLELHTDTSDAEQLEKMNIVQIRAELFALGFDISGSQYMGDRTAPAQTFTSIRFNLAPRYDQNFSGNSVIIAGTVISNETVQPFTYTSSMSGSIRGVFDTVLVVPANGSPMQKIIRLHTKDLFNSGGMLMDPRDPNNAKAIDANMQKAIR